MDWHEPDSLKSIDGKVDFIQSVIKKASLLKLSWILNLTLWRVIKRGIRQFEVILKK